MDFVEVLKKKRSMLDLAFTFNMKELADLMNREGFLSDPDHDTVVGVRSMLSDKEKAGIMVTSLIKKVELNSKNYSKFLGWVKQGGRKFQDVVDVLDVGEDVEEASVPQRNVASSASSGAAGASPSNPLDKVDDKELGEDDLVDILEEVEFLSSDWEMIGTKLGLKADTKRGIQQQYGSPNSRLNAALTAWLQLNYDHGRHGKPSWRKLAKAVERINGKAFENIVKNHS